MGRSGLSRDVAKKIPRTGISYGLESARVGAVARSTDKGGSIIPLSLSLPWLVFFPFAFAFLDYGFDSSNRNTLSRQGISIEMGRKGEGGRIPLLV